MRGLMSVLCLKGFFFVWGGQGGVSNFQVKERLFEDFAS